jgi:ankyrin repeat protein
VESAEEKLLRKDKRGDTPLHAAACNGAIECLLLLLQHGIDPRTKNLSGLKAIDLAVRNRHQKCKNILAEYHLHYCTSSEFDSVLFLATLEVSLLLLGTCK